MIAGAVLTSADGVIVEGGLVGLDADGRMLATAASVGALGSTKPSYAETAEVPCVGLTSDGALGLPWATLTQAGVVRLGSRFGQKNRVPYRVGIGSDTSQQLVNNLTFGGAIQHMDVGSWRDKGMSWLVSLMSDADNDIYFETDAYYMGLATSAQFTQSEEVGLSLVSATADVLAGVYIASSLDDARSNAMLSPSLVKQHVYLKTETYSSSEVNQLLTSYVTKTDLDARDYATKDHVASTCVQQTEQWTGSVYLTAEEYNNLTVRDSRTCYYIVNALS